MHPVQAQFVQQKFRLIERPGAPSWQTHSRFHAGDEEVTKSVIGASDFTQFAEDAYSSKDGYVIRRNPVTGDKEMFVAGTRNVAQWALNIWDIPITLIEHPSQVLGPEYRWVDHVNTALEKTTGVHLISWLDPWRRRKTKHLEQVAFENKVDVIYGHSRGGAIVADMETRDGVKKVGLDAAMLITKNKDLLNLNEAEWFDSMIGTTGQHNKTMNLGPRFHSAWT